MIGGEKDPICDYCWRKESLGDQSQRQVYNRHIGGIIQKHWSKSFEKNKDLKEIFENVDFKNVNSFDLKLGNFCNLKCIMCNPRFSSQLLAEARLNPQLKKFYGDTATVDQYWPQDRKFIEWCQEHLPNSIHIKFTGGEPFLNPYLLDALDKIPLSQKKKCILEFSTNLTVLNKKILKQFKDFKEVWLAISVEGIGDTLEYVRYKHKWDNLRENIDLLVSQKMHNLHLSVSHVVQAPTLDHLMTLTDYFDKLKIKIHPIFLYDPSCFKISALKEKVKRSLLQRLQDYQGYNKDFVTAVSKHVDLNISQDKKLAKQCLDRLQAFDRVRQTDHTRIIPVDFLI